MHTRINGNEITFQNMMELQSIIRHLKGIEKDLKSAPNYADDKYETKLLKLLKGIAANENDKTKGVLRKAHKKDGNLIVTDGYKAAFVEYKKHLDGVYHILKEGALKLDDKPERAYPDAEKIYPKTYEDIITVDFSGIDRAIKSNKKSFVPYGKMLLAVMKIENKTISLIHPETKEVFFSNGFHSFAVKDVKIQFDMKNLLPIIELIKHVAGLKTVTMKYFSDSKPVCFESEGIRSLVMPFVS